MVIIVVAAAIAAAAIAAAAIAAAAIAAAAVVVATMRNKSWSILEKWSVITFVVEERRRNSWFGYQEPILANKKWHSCSENCKLGDGIAQK